MIEWYKKVVFANYANFNGRARRSEYWFFTLMQIIILGLILGTGIAIMGLGNGITGLGVFFFLYIGYALATLIPTLAVTVRRLHDVGKSGWFYFIQLIPLIGAIWFLVLLFTEGDSGENQYGADPKNDSPEIEEIGITEA